ncbi:microtubule-actin cross-linking factor 1, isoforms 1/2/3/4 isoform X6 [Dunckerocampus dactyliophorus]|uniref:microtubule-actin cross-linking factor 1, isoforms 1/2/3/4 isoform X6 n=1 Tax=Dunckerocampus dactyliophorus TaxID=161453 RepID=UPI0024053015|nr:microtubule-actin cross-linking factor 1, isoforms 1/2/3/4 isoform X6 [Dunckerocampus dactyliophorus]
MGNSIGCIRPLREGEPSGSPPLSHKRRLHFRRRQKRKKMSKDGRPEQRHEPDDDTKPAAVETLHSDVCGGGSSHLMVPKLEYRRTLSPNSEAQHTPKLSPAWRGILCLPGEEDTVSGTVDVSSIPSQTATTSPVYTAQALGSTTPGAGRVYLVREKVYGVLQKASILEEDKKDDKRTGTAWGKSMGRRKEEFFEATPSVGEHKGVVHIREVDGKLCVVRTVYPSDFGTPAWRGDCDREVEVHQEPPAPFPVTENILKVQLSEDERDTFRNQTWVPEVLGLDMPDRAPERSSLLESSGYASDLLLTSPETAVTTPKWADWGALTSSSSERLDTTVENPQASGPHLAQISEIYVCGESGDLTAKEKLLLWSQQATEGYPGLRCINFTSSWSDGRMFNALLHRYRPDLINMEAVSQQSNRDNLEQAFEIAESLGVTRLLDAEDVDVASPDEKSVITYVSSIYDAFPKIPEGGEGIAAQDVDQRWSEYQSSFSSLLQWSRQQTALMANKNFPQNPVELKALYNQYVHFKDMEIPAKEVEKGHVEHLYKLLEVWVEFGRIKLPQGLHPNHLDQEWGKLILEMLEREKALRPAVDRLELLLQRANKFQKLAVDFEEKLTLAKNILQADMSRAESGEIVQCESELACYLQDFESLMGQIQQELKVLREEKYYQVDQLAFRASCLQEEMVSLRLQCSSVYRKGHFSQSLGNTATELLGQRAAGPGFSLGQTLLGAAGATGAVGVTLLRRPVSRSQLVAMSSSEDEGSLRFVYELLGWVEETQEPLEGAEWGADLPSVENNLQEHNSVHAAVEELMSGLQEARSYEEHSSWRLRSLESLHVFVSHCTEELIWLNEREEEEIAYDWSHNNANMAAKRDLYSELRSELDEKHHMMRSLQETAHRLCQENHPAKQTLEAYSAALQTQWQWVDQLCVCVEQHLRDNTLYFQFMSDARDCESYLRQLQETIKRQYTCDRGSRLSRLEDLLQDSMDEKEQLIEYRGTVASLVGRAKTVVQLRPRSAESPLRVATPIRAVCDYKQIEITISMGDECVLEDNSQRTKWKVISPTGNEAMVPSVCFTVPPPNQEAVDTACRAEQLYQKVMSLWHQLHVNMKSVVSWHYLLKDVRTVSEWNLDTVRCQSPSERQQVLDCLESQLADFLSDSRESSLFMPAEMRELEVNVRQAQQHCQDLLHNMETEEKDESVSRSHLSELQNVTLRLNEAEQRLMNSIQTPPPSRLSGDSGDNAVGIAEHEVLQSELDGLRSSLGAVSRRCVAFFEEKPTSSSAPVLRLELNQAVEKMDKLHILSSVFLEKLKMVDVLIRCLEDAENQVRKYESRLSEEDIVPADTTAIQSLRDQIGKWQSELTEHEGIFQSLESDVLRAKEAGSQLSRLHPDRSPELDRYQERANQVAERWNGVKRQIETRRSELDSLGSVLQQYRDAHSALIRWIEETTERQENAQPGQTDSKVLSEQLAQQTALVAEIEENQTKLDECQTHSKQYCTLFKDYELQLMTFRAFVESTNKSQVKRRRMNSSSDAITQEFMDLRTRYTALVTLTTQHVKYISDALRRLEEEEKEVEEEKQARVGQVADLLGWVQGLQGRTGGPNAESSLAAQQAISEQLAAKKDDVAEAIRSTQVFLLSKRASKLSPEERAHVEAQLNQLRSTYKQMCDSSTQQLKQLERQLAKEEERKNDCIAGVIDLGTVETFPVFQAARRGLIDQETCHFLLEAQLINTGGLLSPDATVSLSLDQSLIEGLIDPRARQSLSELEGALLLVENTLLNVHTRAAAVESGLVREEVGFRILELKGSAGLLEQEDLNLLPSSTLTKLESRLQHKELIDPNTAEKLSLDELQQRCVRDDDSGLLLLPVKQQPGGTVCLRSGRKVGIFRAIEEGLIDRQVAQRLLEAQLFAGGIVDPLSGHRLTVHEAVHHGLMDQDLACALFVRQLKNGGILDPLNMERLDLEESIDRDLLSSPLALLVLESLWTFMGILWPESGEVLSVVEAFQQGAISGELTRSILRQRKAIGALYNSETLQLLPLSTAAEEVLGPMVVRCLKDIHLPDLLLNMNQSGTPSLNRLSWVSSSSSPLASAPPHLVGADGLDLDQQAKHKLLLHLVTHSYVDAHSGKRLVLLDPELVELVNAYHLKARDRDVLKDLSVTEKADAEEGTSNGVTPHKALEPSVTNGTQEISDNKNDNKWLPKPLLVVEDEETESLESRKSLKNELPPKPEMLTQEVPVSKLAKPAVDVPESALGEQEDDDELSRLVLDLTKGGLLTEDGEKLLPDEAVAQGMLPGHTVVKLMAQAGLFGGFLDAIRGESLSLDDVMQEGLLDEDLMWSVLKSDKTLAGIVDVERRQICGVREAAQAGLIDANTAARLLEAQVASGGVVDLHRNKKVSVTLASNLGLTEDNQREELLALEKAYKGKVSGTKVALTKASLQLQMEGVIDPETECPVPLEQPTKKGLINPRDAYQVLLRQVAEGGIIHHASGMRLSVSDAVDRGLVARSIAPGLEELERACQGKVSPSNPEAAALQATTGAVFDSNSSYKVTLAEAVSRDLLQEKIANEVMASNTVTQGVLDPQTALTVPYSDLVKKGKIDIETGKRFLEVKAIRGIENTTRSSLTLPEAVAKKQVDPVPALRLLQSQADSGGIIDITTGERLPLPEALRRGLVSEDMVVEIATNQILKGGLVDPTTGQRVLNLSDAVASGLVSSHVASAFHEKGSPLQVKSDDDSWTVTSSHSPHSPQHISSTPLSPNTEVLSWGGGETLASEVSGDRNEEVDMERPVSGADLLLEPDRSIDLLSKFATNVEKRIQQAIQEAIPQTHTSKSHKAPTPTCATPKGDHTRDDRREESIPEGLVAESTRALANSTDKHKEEDRGGASDGKPEKVQCRSLDESSTLVKGFDEPLTDSRTAETTGDTQEQEQVNPSDKERRMGDFAQRNDEEASLDTESKAGPAIEQEEQPLESLAKETESKSKNKRWSKKKASTTEEEVEVHQASAGEKPEKDASKTQKSQTSGPPQEDNTESKTEDSKVRQEPTKMSKDTVNVDKRKEQKSEVDQQSVSGQDVEQELPPKCSLPDEQEATLTTKAKESILKKVFKAGVSDKKLQALVRKKEIASIRDVGDVTRLDDAPKSEETFKEDKDIANVRDCRENVEKEPLPAVKPVEGKRSKKKKSKSLKASSGSDNLMAHRGESNTQSAGRDPGAFVGGKVTQISSTMEDPSWNPEEPMQDHLKEIHSENAAGSHELQPVVSQSQTSRTQPEPDKETHRPEDKTTKRLELQPQSEAQQLLWSPEAQPILSEEACTDLGSPELRAALFHQREGDNGDVTSCDVEAAVSPSHKSSLVRQELLEHDQRMVALVSTVGHVEVGLKQQQQRRVVGCSLAASEDIIRQTQALDVELRDLEPEIAADVEAAEKLLKPHSKDVPDQLLLALEKDQRSLDQGYQAARMLSRDVLRSLQEHRDAHKEAVTAELKSLGGRVEALLFWLMEMEAEMSEGMAGSEKVEDDRGQHSHQLHLCKELQSSLTACSSEVSGVALDIQVFISEQAQDRAPKQSRRLLGQLEQLQRAFHSTAGQARDRADTLSAQLGREEEKRRRGREEDEAEKLRRMQSAREREVVQQQKAECSQKIKGLSMWLAGAASLLANQRAGTESDDMNALQQKQKKLKEVQKDLRTRAEDVAEAIRFVEDFLVERGDSLSPEEREQLQVALARLKDQYSTLMDSADTLASQLDTAINVTVQHNTQRAKAFEELQETQVQIDSLLKDLQSSPNQAAQDVTDHSTSQPDCTVASHTEALQAKLQRLQSQQAQLLRIAQSARSLLDQPDSTVPPEEKRRLRATLDQLQAQHQGRLQSCQERLRKSEALKDELAKFLQEHGTLGSWLEESEQELRSLGKGETDAQELKNRLEEHRKLAEDVICHKADLRFISISGQKVLDSVQGVLEQAGGLDQAMEGTKQLVAAKLQDANHRYTSLHAKSAELGGRLSGLLERYQQYQDEVVSLHLWLSTQEQNQSIAKPSGDTDPRNLQSTLRQVQLLQDELAERSVQLEKVKRAGRVLVSTDESPSLKAVDILCAADGLEKRFCSLSASVSERAEQLQMAVAQSVSVQEGLKALLSWLDTLVLNAGPVQPTVQALQDALTQNQKLCQELLSRQGSVEATRDSVSKLLQSPDASTASGLQGSLDELTRKFAAAQAIQAEREAALKTLLPTLESYERLGADLRVFIQGRMKALSPGGQPDRSVEDYRQTVEEVKSELQQEAAQLKSFCSLAEELGTSQVLDPTQSLLDHDREVTEDFNQLEDNVNQRLAAIVACEQQLLHFRGLSGSLLRWLQAAQEQLPAKELSTDTEALQRRVQQLQDLLKEWESQGCRVQQLNKSGSELEAQVINITAPQTKTSAAPQINGSAGPSSVNGIHTCKDLTEIQVAVSYVNARHEALGSDLKERLGRQQASLELRLKARRGAEDLKNWLKDKEVSLGQGGTASPSKPEAVHTQAQENKALLSELAEHSARVEELKGALRKLIADNPDSPEADAWRQQLQEIDSHWLSANQTAALRQAELEACADRLGNFAAAASQLGPWLREKELMMSVLGPLSIDPNMLNTQKQQVQFMLREFDTRRPQFDQLTQSAEGILSQTQDTKELEEVQAELDSISLQWQNLTGRLTRRSEHIGQAQGTSERYQALLRELSSSMSALGERLDAQALLSARPEELKVRLQETGEIRSELERRRAELGEAERLCQELSTIVVEPYLKDELKKRLESVSGPLKNLEDRAADGLSQLQAALSSTQQFQQMFEDLRSWLDQQAELRDSSLDSLPCRPDAIHSLMADTDDLQRSVASQRGSYELIQAEGASLLSALPAGGDERAALQSRLARLRQDWEEVNGRVSDRESRLKSTLSKAERYQQHKAELMPWLAECEGKDAEIQPSLDSSGLDEALQKARGLALDLERRTPLLEAFNAAADQLLEQCCIGEEEVRDEKAQLNRRLDGLAEGLHGRTSQLEELAGRLKEFEEGQQAVERRLEAAKHQIEVQEALGPQACSTKSLERLRSQQESLRCLQPQVVYLRDLAQGLVQDAPHRQGGNTEGAQRLQEQAKNTEAEYEDVTNKIEQCCSTLESRLHDVSEVQSHVRDVFSRLADMDDELDSLGPVGRNADSLASQADTLGGFLSHLAALRTELEAHASDCTAMLRREGSSPDLLALRRETEALSRQAGKLSERGQARLVQIEDAAERVADFYRLVGELRGLLGAAEEGLDVQGVVGSEVDVIKHQLQEFKALEREQVDGIQAKLQHVNAVGQGLIQSAAKQTDTRALEHDLESTNLRWNSLNKRVAERIAQLQEALLHCGKFQDALEPLLSWLSDTEELVANQKPPSAEYRVVKAQIQEQKLLQRLLDDRRPTVEMIGAEGERIAATADAQDRDKIQTQLQSLARRWSDLLDKASCRQRQLEELQVLALEFHEALEPLGEWLSATERRLSSAEPMGTQTAKISQQIVKHKAIQDDVSSREAEVDRLRSLIQLLGPLSCAADRDWLGERVEAVHSGHAELAEWCARRAGLLEHALANARLFGEDEVEVLNWLAEVGQRLALVSVQSYQPDVLARQHKHTLSLNEEIVSRRKTVDQAIKNGQALLKQTTGEEVLLIQEKLDGIKSRYGEVTAGSGKALRTLEQALQLATRFASAHDDLNQWLDAVEAEINNVEPDATPTYQERQKELKNVSAEKCLVLDTLNEVGGALLDLLPWRAREVLDRLVADANQRYRQADDTITQRVQLVQAAIQRSQQYEEAVDAELAWVGETERKLASLGPLSLEPDVTVAQLQVQRAFNIDIIRHKDTVDQLLTTRDDILETCSDAQKDALMVKTDSLSARYDAVSQSHSERFSALEQAQVLVARFWETYEELEPWLGEAESLITQLPPPAIDTDALRLQQDQMRLLRESIAEHKPHIDKLLKIGPQLAELSVQEGARVTQRYGDAERRYFAIKEEVKGRAALLDEAVSQSAQSMIALKARLTQLMLMFLHPPSPPLRPNPRLCPHSRPLNSAPFVSAVICPPCRRPLLCCLHMPPPPSPWSLLTAITQLMEFHDKMDPLLETLEAAVQRLRQPPPVAAEVEKIREQLAEHRAQGLELDKLLPSFSALCARGEELISRAAHDDPAAQAVHSRLLRLRSLWDEIRQRAEERESKLNDVLDLAGKFWADVAALMSTLRDSQDIVKELEDPGVDPSLIKQQIEAAEAIKAETDGLREELEFVRTLGADLIFACGETEKPEVKKTIDEMNGAWEGLNRTWRERMERLDEAMSASVQYQDALQSMFDYLDNAVIKLCDMSTVGTDLGTVKHQIEELKQYKVDVYQQQIDMEKLCHQGELLLKKVSDQTDRDMIQEPLTELRHLWDNLGDKITQRQHKLEAALLALGQFQHALSELQAWLSHTYTTLDTHHPVSSDPKAIEIELAKHHVLRNDVLSHHATVEAVNTAATELLESSPGDEASHLRDQLDQLNQSWQNLLLKTQERQKLLEAALQQAEGFHGELEEFLQWMRRTESQLSATKPTGGLPETAREQLEQHMELQAQLIQRADQYHRLLDAGESMLLARGGEDVGLGATQTQQNLAMLQNKWASLNTKMDDRRAKLEEALSLATIFQTSLQDTINWLTQAEQTLNMTQPPSLLLDTVLFQIDEHKVFVNEVNTHREQVLALEKAGSQLRFASLKQDVVLIKNLLLSVQARWDKLVQRSLDRGRHLDESRKRAKQFHEAWRKLTDWLEEAEKRLDSELEIPNEPDKIKVQLLKHKEFQKALGSKQPVYDTTVRSGRAMRDKAQLPDDTQKLDHLVGEVRDKWDTVCGKSVERQHKLEEALLFSGQFAEALQALVDWLYRVEPQLAEDQPVHGDLDLVSNLMDSHKAFQKELGKRTGSVQALRRSARDLMETGRDDTAWVKVQLQELSNRWETVCALSVTKQTRLQQALKQAEEFRTAVQMLLEWLSEAEQSLRFRGVLPEEAETLQALLHTHRNFLGTVEEKRSEVNKAVGMGEAILTLCHPDSITTIKHWITIIRARFEEVLTWAKQHEQRLEAALTEVLNNANLLEELLSWLQWAETTLVQRDTEALPQDIPQLKNLITEHQMFMEEMTRKQPDVDKVTKSYKRKPAEPPSSLAERRGGRKQQQQQAAVQLSGANPRLNQLCARWQQVWLLALDRQRKLNDDLDRLEELKEFANFDFDVWRKKYMRWMNHKKSRVMDFFRRIDKDQDGKITRQEFIDGILASKFPTSKLEMTAVADIFDRDGDGYIDYYEFVAALHPNKDAYRPTTDADKIEDEVTRQVAQCKCAKRFQVEQIGENKYRFFLGNQFGDSQQLRLVRILRSTVMVRVGGGWMALDEFLVKNDPCRVQHPGLKILRSDSSSSISSRIVAVTPGYFCCRARGRTNLELREKFILPEGTPQCLAAFRSRGRRSKPGSRNASPTRSSSSASHSGASLPSAPSTPATPTASASSRSSHTHSRDYAKPWLAHSKTPMPPKSHCCPDLTDNGHEVSSPHLSCLDLQGAASASKLKRPTFHSSRGSLTGENGGTPHGSKPTRSDPRRGASSASGPASRAGSRAGSRASSRRGSDASDAFELQDARSVCSDTSDTPRRPGGRAKPSKIPTITKKTPSSKTPGGAKK